MKQQRIDDYEGHPTIAWRYESAEERAYYAPYLEPDIGAKRVTYPTADCSHVLTFETAELLERHWQALHDLTQNIAQLWRLRCALGAID